jgi:hypothetical protein
MDSKLNYNLDVEEFKMMLLDALKPKMEVFFEADEKEDENDN